jgi:GDSL-like Lipase/Acylhydrolase family
MIRPSNLAIVLGMIAMTVNLSAAVIPVTDSNLLSGLTLNDWVCQADSINSAADGASLTLGFAATQQVVLQVDNAHLAGAVASRYPIIAWSVNGGALQTRQLAAGETSVVLVSGVANPVIDLFIKGMSPFEDRYTGDVPPNSVKITGFVVDLGGSTTTASVPGKVWLNIGDSIMSGDAAAYSAGQGRPPDDLWAASDDARASYGYLLAQHYGYRETRLAYGGYDWGGGLANVPALTTLIDQKTSTMSRLTNGFLNPIPNVVLINLGENGAPTLTDVTQALVKLRSRVKPATKIIVMVPAAGTARTQITQAFNSYTNSTSDACAFLVDLGSVTFATADGQHPTAQGHQTIYQAALPFFDPIINPAPYRVCPMGDSITAGYTDNPNWTVPFNFGYRSGLYTRLTNSGVSFQFVGTSPEPWNGADGTVTNIPAVDLRVVDQDHHEGYGGKTTAFVLSNIGNWLAVDRPHIILLMAGINDIGNGSTGEPTATEQNLSNIVYMVVNNSPNTHLIVAQITPYSSYTDSITRYNNYIANTLVPHFASLGKLVTTVNQYTNLCVPGTTNIDSTLFANGINHPNATAYDRMARTWFAGIQALNLPPSPPPVIQSNFPVQPGTASAFVGEQITFSTLVSDPSLAYQWLVISSGVTNPITGATNTTLTLTNLQLTNTASYCLQASNILGVGLSAVSSLTVNNLPAPVNNIVIAIAAETGRGGGVFVPGWVVATNKSLIAGQTPSSAIGNFSLEAAGRNVNSLTAGDNGALSVITGPSGQTSSTNYVTCGNGGGAGSSITYTLGGSAYGYDLTNITVYGGWADNGRDQQAYTVYYSTVMSPSIFVPLSSVNSNPTAASGMQSATRISLQSGNAPLATNVAAVMFDFTTPSSENGYCGYDQIALFGSVSAPGTIISDPPPPVLTQIVQNGFGQGALDGNFAVNLIRAGQSSLASVSASHAPRATGGFVTSGLNDGSAAGTANEAYYGNNDPNGGNLPVTVTFNLNTNHAAGYTLTRIQSVTGWSDSYLANVKFQLLLSLNGGPFTSYGNFSATNTLNGGNNSILLTVTNTSGPIASGVTAVQFAFSTPPGPQGGAGGTLIRELQVFGTPIVNLAVQALDADNLRLTWPQGILLEATNLSGPWTTNALATSPFTNTPDAPQKYYRVRVQ